MRQKASISELSRLTGLDRGTLRNYLSHLEPASTNGKKGATDYYLDEVLAALVKSYKAKFDDGPKVRRELADAEKAEINVARLRGELVPIDAVRSSAAELVKSLYQRCVNLAPRLVSDKIAATTDRNEIEIAIRNHYAGIFDELRSRPNDFLKLQVDQPEDAASV